LARELTRYINERTVTRLGCLRQAPSASRGARRRLNVELCGARLSASIRNYGNVFAVIFFHHGDTEATEVIFLFAHRETAMGKKNLYFR
jgi:hypothetical protein